LCAGSATAARPSATERSPRTHPSNFKEGSYPAGWFELPSDCSGYLLRKDLHFQKEINLSPSLAGQAVGIKEVDDGIWLVSFMNYDLGYIDLEERTLQPLDNPFGPKVLPMS
jgi:hypothetical protein